MDVDDLRPLPLFAGLTDEQLTELLAAGVEVRIVPGVDLFHEGDHADRWWVLVDGSIDLLRRVGREDVVVGHLDVPGRWAGGFRAWDEHGVYLATGRGVSPGRLLAVPSSALRERINAWFPFGGHLVQGLSGTARTIESTVRQRESLVTLGTLAAGLAHEINNPAAAATRAVDALESVCSTLLSSLGRLAQAGISPDQFIALDALRREIEPAAVLHDPMDLADREDAISAWLARRGVDREWVVAPPLAAAGADVEWCERAAALLGDAVGPGLEWVGSTWSVDTLLFEVKESTRRVSELVAAVRSYSQMDRASMQHVDVTEGLESTLLVLGHTLGDGIVVERSYDPAAPRIDGYPGELNQVWTNLIGNAVDAMGGGGTLSIAVRPEGDQLVVEIGDTGPGMSPEVAARAFEAFYTTKDVGKGTGLGLDIARRIIVERHGGAIEVDSHPGRTIMRVRLPVAPRR